ncbi:MAG TPA: AraC family transcriptional regulator ligand-binding domain-containing protein [Steroidobacteraceae bacterium]|jgi:AraC-like DNA-binding protein|nr:AraC family transcriptional regulator ligand-binding domain-containing protein [Steroidobacteraceae bacterium]
MQQNTMFFSLDGPLSAGPADFQTRAVHLRGFSELVRGYGRRPEGILERYAIDSGLIDQPDGYVDALSLLDMFEYCSRALRQPLFGLQLARLQSTHPLGSIVPLCRSAPDLRTALAAACTYLPILHCPQCLLELVEGQRVSELRFGAQPARDGLEQMTYGSMFTLLALLRSLGDDAAAPVHIATTFSPSAQQLETLEAVLACRVLTGAQRNALAFPTTALDRPLLSADRVIFRLLTDYFARVGSARRNAVVQRVESYIRGALSTGPTLGRCARALGYSSRALQLKLDEQAVSFTDLLARLRIELARACLASDELSLDEIAARLGYADQTSFGRAFRRWTGATPGDFARSGGTRRRM